MRVARWCLVPVLSVILLCGSFVGGARYGAAAFDWLGLSWIAPAPVVTSSTEPADVEPTFQLFWQAWNVVTHNYVDKGSLDVKALTYGAIRGMVSALGDTGHSRFLPPQDYRQEESSLRGAFTGIGAEVGLRAGQPIIVQPLDGSPAQNAGLRAGDAIVRINGEDVSHATLQELTTKLRGDAGTTLVMTVQHQDADTPVDVTITRGRIAVQPVSSYVLPDSNVADVRLSDFSGSAATDLQSVLKSLGSQHVAGIVLDLRDNPGGILDQAVQVTSQFMDSGTVAVVKDAGGKESKLDAKPGGEALNVPLTVLVNSGTASAAEIVAGALQENHRATLIGQPTFGTSTVLSTFRLKDGSAILLGTSEWLTPNGEALKGKGIQPNVPVRLTAQSQVLTPAREKSLTADQIASSGDAQLLAAVQYLSQHPEVRTGPPPA
ncbi:MAG TPA: S41 family peptidase [Chloroflexota bacterium]|jgi:carboxyl-terminal processing protease|nr:S41 family peptidase [Chloroflexota bacterium]